MSRSISDRNFKCYNSEMAEKSQKMCKKLQFRWPRFSNWRVYCSARRAAREMGLTPLRRPWIKLLNAKNRKFVRRMVHEIKIETSSKRKFSKNLEMVNFEQLLWGNEASDLKTESTADLRITSTLYPCKEIGGAISTGPPDPPPLEKAILNSYCRYSSYHFN